MEETKVDKKKFYHAIIEILTDSEPLTARQIGRTAKMNYHLGLGDRQAVQPRLTELVGFGTVQVCGKRFDALTKKKVSTYSLKGE